MRDDAGITLVEVMTASALMLTALLLFGMSLSMAQQLQVRNDTYSRANDDVHLAMQELDRQIRSGYVATDSDPTGTNSAVKIFTEAGGQPKCVIWALADSGDGRQALFTTSWTPGALQPVFDPATWRRAASSIVNSWPENRTFVPLDKAFELVPAAGADILKSLQVRLFLNSSTREAQTVEIQSTFTSRNVVRSLEEVVGVAGLPTGTNKGDVCGA